MMNELKVKPAVVPPEKEKVSFRLPVPTITSLELYVDLYAKTYGVVPDRDYVANEIFTSFFNSDKEFLVHLRDQEQKAATNEDGRKRGRKRKEGQQAVADGAERLSVGTGDTASFT